MAQPTTTAILLSVLVVVAGGCDRKSAPESEPSHKPKESEAAEKPAPKDDIVSEEVTYEAGDRTIHGTLTRPKGDGKHPGLMMIAGSGTTDRNWMNPGMPGKNGSGRLLAEAITRAGFVVLRYDKLGTGKTAAPAKVSFDDYEAEQKAGVAFLRAHKSSDAARTFVAGHSEGGVHAIRVAAKIDPTLAGVLLFASAGRAFRDILYSQLAAQYAASGLKDDAVTKTLKPFADALDDIIAGRAVDPKKASEVPGIQGIVASYSGAQGLPFSRVVLEYDPAQGIKQLKMPIFIVNGEKDMQVSPEKDAKRLESGARAGGNADVTLKLVANANHVLKLEKKPRAQLDANEVPSRYNAKDVPLDPDAIGAIVDWLETHTKN